ncbi:MAG: TMEM43 family protein, partial [Acetobacteraceae bacterium]|nr:TMEM43 family protein [Acetobacteraceae bacterium]
MSDDASGSGDGGYDSSDSATEVTSRSWFDRIKGALLGLVFGLLLIPGGVWLLAWNEGRAVQTARSLAEGGKLVVAVAPDRVDPAREGRLVHLTGPLAVPGTLADPGFPVRVEGATRLRRTVEMYQWKEERRSETRSRLGGGQETVTTYSYTRAWSDQPQDSSRFHQPGGHANPPMPTRSQTLVAEEGRIGAYRLDAAVLGQLGAFQPLPAAQIG